MSVVAWCALLLIAVGDFWQLSFTPHPENIGVLVITRCQGETPFYAYQWADVEPTMSHASVYRAWPKEQDTQCFTTGEVMRSPTGSPLDAYTGESTAVSN